MNPILRLRFLSVPVLSLAVVAAPLPAEAAEAAGFEPGPPEPRTLPPLETEERAAAAQAEGLYVKDAPLNEVLQYLARRADRQFFHNAALQGEAFKVTGHFLEEDPLRQMEDLAAAWGLTLHATGRTVMMFTADQLTRLPRTEWTCRLRYLRAADTENLQKMVGALLTPESGASYFEPKTGTLLVIDTGRAVQAVAALLRRLDVPRQQVVVETRILQVRAAKAGRAGVDWSRALGEGLPLTLTQSLNAAFGLPDLSTVTRSAGTVKTLERALSPAASSSASLSRAFSEESAQSFTGGGGLFFDPLTAGAVIRALKEENLVREIAAPVIVTEDNEQAAISINDRFPLITAQIQRNETGVDVTETVRYKIDSADPDPSASPDRSRELGTRVTVKPTILPDGTIRMVLRPHSARIAELIRGAAQPGGVSGNVYPRVREVTSECVARVPAGQSLIIGGFYDETETRLENGVPLLARVPVLKLFTSSREKGKERTSLVFVVTPRLYNPVTETAGAGARIEAALAPSPEEAPAATSAPPPERSRRTARGGK